MHVYFCNLSCINNYVGTVLFKTERVFIIVLLLSIIVLIGILLYEQVMERIHNGVFHKLKEH